MGIFKEYMSNVLHTATGVLQYPVVILLILFMAAALASVGWLIAEFFGERRHMKLHLPGLLDEIRAEEKPIVDIVKASGLLKSQKQAVIEVTKHPRFTPLMRDSLVTSLVENEQSYYDRKLKITDLMAKISPMLGLMGTLIPLGPGIIALGQGDTYTLSQSLKIAFDTTIAGLVVAAIGLVISTIRKGWYNGYMSVLEAVMECVLEMENMKNGPTGAPAAKASEPVVQQAQPQTQPQQAAPQPKPAVPVQQAPPQAPVQPAAPVVQQAPAPQQQARPVKPDEIDMSRFTPEQQQRIRQAMAEARMKQGAK